MKEWALPADQTDRRGQDGIVLVALGGDAEAGPSGAPLLAGVTRRLAELLEQPVLELEPATGPDAALTALVEQAQGCERGWLAGLPIDLGVTLAEGRCWAEVLGAWRQPTLLVIPAAQLTGGVPAAATALLRQWQVPLLGLLQCGGVWQAEERRRDGLPWLGQLADDSAAVMRESDKGQALLMALALRWRQLDRP
jgi:hypothetical protein